MRLICSLVCLLAAAIPAAGQKQGPVPVSAGIAFEERWQALGRAIAADYAKRTPLLDDPVTTAFVQRLADRLQSGTTVKVTLQLQPSLAAFPGEFFFVSAALLTTSQSESELAAVVAHQMGHVAMLRRQWAAPSTGPASPGTTILPNAPMMIGPAGNCLRFPDSQVLPMLAREKMRPRETEADRLALAYLSAAGYDPSALLSVFERLNPNAPDKVDGAALRPLLPDGSERPAIVSTSEFQAIQDRVTPLVHAQKKPPTLFR